MPPPAGGPAERWLPRLLPALVAVATFVAFLPSLRNQFITWDDDVMFLQNPHYRGLGWTELQWMWTTFRPGSYRPLAWMSYGADYLAWGLNPFGYHLSNLLGHTLAAVLVYALGLRLGRLASAGAGGGTAGIHLGAAVAALVFALHPLRTEVVAAVSARGDILSAVFALLTVLSYLEAAGAPVGSGRRRGWLGAAVVWFACSVLSKSTALVLPVVLVVLDVYPLRRLGEGSGRDGGWFGPAVRPVWVEKVPFVVLALAAVPLAFLSKMLYGALGSRGGFDPLVGPSVAFFGFAFYLWKTLVPSSLSPLYERPPQLDPLAWPFLLSAVVVVAITGLLLAARRRWPAGLAAWVSYAALLAPVLGVIPFGPPLVADRYSYLACLGWAFLAGAGVRLGWERWRRGTIGTPLVALTGALTVTALAGWGVLSFRHAQVWRDSKTFWSYTALVSPESGIAHSKLGLVLEEDGRLAEATAEYREAVALWPGHAGYRINLGRALSREGYHAEAVEQLRRALEPTPTFPGYVALAAALTAQGALEEAIEAYRSALRIQPASAGAHYHLGRVLARAGRLPEAAEHYGTALRLRPDLLEAQISLGLVYFQQDRLTGGGSGGSAARGTRAHGSLLH
ncbi:MAG: tetratricopeptide repeat protein [Candidatus Rokubacteria bacterium]|nr:tetratricopeptide repeat protein [Candidatus Rokubacteria bacterium]